MTNIIPITTNQAMTYMDNALVDGRQVPDKDTLTFLVVAEIAGFVNAGETFTAYSITKNLRQKFSTIEIEHQRNEFTLGEKTVQELTHEMMPVLMDAYQFTYDAEYRWWFDNEALTYYPVPLLDGNTDDEDDVRVSAQIYADGSATITISNNSNLPKPKFTKQINWPKLNSGS
jgi:hypothetical protein